MSHKILAIIFKAIVKQRLENKGWKYTHNKAEKENLVKIN